MAEVKSYHSCLTHSCLTQSWLTQSILDEITDPCLKEPLENAQEVNCGDKPTNGGHVFSLKTVESLFKNPNPICPTCNKKITTFVPNYAVQRLVNAVIGKEKGQAHLELIYKVVKDKLLQKESQDEWFYPLAEASFTSESHDLIMEGNDVGARFRNSNQSKTCLEVFYFGREGSRYICSLFFYRVESMLQFKEELIKHKIKIGFESCFISKEEPMKSSISLTLRVEAVDTTKFFDLLAVIARHNQFDDQAQANYARAISRLKESEKTS